MSLSRFSRSQLYCWRRGEQLERKKRQGKIVAEATVANVAALVVRFPHFGGRKGQAFMLYHGLGYIGMRAYDAIKWNVKRLLAQAVSERKLVPGREFYEHVRAEKVGEIWGEDFTEMTVEGRTFKAAVLLDIYDTLLPGLRGGLPSDGRASAQAGGSGSREDGRERSREVPPERQRLAVHLGGARTTADECGDRAATNSSLCSPVQRLRGRGDA
jgi:hypothetical protein